jgi:hypothetical protein
MTQNEEAQLRRRGDLGLELDFGALGEADGCHTAMGVGRERNHGGFTSCA